MQTLITDRYHNQRIKTDFRFVQIQNPESAYSKKQLNPSSGKRIARILYVSVGVIILMSALISGLRAYSSNLEVKMLQNTSEIQKVEESINELQNEIDMFYSNLLLNRPISDTELADCGYFVTDTWEVGG